MCCAQCNSASLRRMHHNFWYLMLISPACHTDDDEQDWTPWEWFRLWLGGCHQWCQHFHDMYISVRLGGPVAKTWNKMMKRTKSRRSRLDITKLSLFAPNIWIGSNWRGRTNNSSGGHHTCDNPSYCRPCGGPAHNTEYSEICILYRHDMTSRELG